MPNASLASAVTANYNLPDPEQAVLLDLGVSYDSDLSVVEKVTVDVGRQVMRAVDGGVPGFSPFIRYHTFADSSIQFTVILRGKDYVSQYLIKHEFIQQLHRRWDATLQCRDGSTAGTAPRPAAAPVTLGPTRASSTGRRRR